MSRKESAKGKGKALLPLLSRHEHDDDFIREVIREHDAVTLLLVIDQDSMSGMFGFAATEIMQGNKLMENLSETLHELHVIVEEVTEWGDTKTKILQIAKLKEASTIILKKQGNHYFKKLTEALEKELPKKIALKII